MRLIRAAKLAFLLLCENAVVWWPLIIIILLFVSSVVVTVVYVVVFYSVTKVCFVCLIKVI